MSVRVFNALIRAEFDSLLDRVVANLESNRRNASGETRKSLGVEVLDDTDGAATYTLYGASWIDKLESGTSPEEAQKIPNFFTVIREWVKAKGIATTPIEYKREPSSRWSPKYTPDERGMRAAAGAIAYKIRRDGTKIYRDGGVTNIYTEAVDATDAQIQQTLERETMEIISRSIRL